MSAVIGLIRHGRTLWNEERRVQGVHDSPLSPSGAEAVLGWSRTLAPYGFQSLYTSPLGRALRTADMVGQGLGLTPRVEPGLREQAFGGWTGRTVPELRAEGELAPQEALGWAFTPPEGESRGVVLQRAWDTLERLAALHEGGRVLAVTHEGVIRAVLYAILGRDYLPCEPKILEPRALHILEARAGCLRITAMNLPL